MNKTYQHTHHAHCESGVISSILRHHGLHLSEPMVFGLANALNFAYIPFVKMGGMPLIAYRSMPKTIIKNIKKNLNLDIKLETFSSKEAGQKKLDALLAEGKVVGVQSSIYWLDYFPKEMRFHFNAHNLLIYGIDEDEYLVSDPVFDMPVRCHKDSLNKARFAKGVMAPKGLLYYPTDIPKEIDLKPIIAKNIKTTSKTMLRKFVPIAGLTGMRYLAKSILKLKTKDKKYTKLFLANIVRMQEEIGTGGAGFRFMYASFLQEASEIFDDDKTLLEASKLMLEVGDEFREFALMIAKALKSKKDIPFDAISKKLLLISQNESKVYKKLLTFEAKL
ncbi:MAG: BtrH N-terminal domain-containing protein [Epsilonproteobacteria bacterium]|nr:BtrH N-terminal domain-containing protein [Campylobacterota bacterium]